MPALRESFEADSFYGLHRDYGRHLAAIGQKRATVCCRLTDVQVERFPDHCMINGLVREGDAWYDAAILTTQSRAEISAMTPARGLWCVLHLCGQQCCCLYGVVAAEFEEAMACDVGTLEPHAVAA